MCRRLHGCSMCSIRAFMWTRSLVIVCDLDESSSCACPGHCEDEPISYNLRSMQQTTPPLILPPHPSPSPSTHVLSSSSTATMLALCDAVAVADVPLPLPTPTLTRVAAALTSPLITIPNTSSASTQTTSTACIPPGTVSRCCKPVSADDSRP